jgi:Fur family transcriptional regulator, ferric uptake regulator
VASIELHERVGVLLQSERQRYTAARRRLVDVLAGATYPLTIPEIIERDGQLAQSSAYRNLVLLERAGVVQRIVATGEWYRFELTDVLTEHHHHHLICASCGAVQDVEVPDALERRLDLELAGLASAAGFRLEHHRLDLVGRCVTCV